MVIISRSWRGFSAIDQLLSIQFVIVGVARLPKGRARNVGSSVQHGVPSNALNTSKLDMSPWRIWIEYGWICTRSEANDLLPCSEIFKYKQQIWLLAIERSSAIIILSRCAHFVRRNLSE